jgi:hypothetical protein
MKLTDEEREELKELYNTYKDVKDSDSLKLLGGLIRTSKWYKNHKITLQCIDTYVWPKYVSDTSYLADYYYIDLTIQDILITKCDQIVVAAGKQFIILYFLYRLINAKNFKLYKPI